MGTASLWQRFVREEEGQAEVEYGLLIGIVSLVLILTVRVLGIRAKFALNQAANAIRTTT